MLWPAQSGLTSVWRYARSKLLAWEAPAPRPTRCLPPAHLSHPTLSSRDTLLDKLKISKTQTHISYHLRTNAADNHTTRRRRTRTRSFDTDSQTSEGRQFRAGTRDTEAHSGRHGRGWSRVCLTPQPLLYSSTTGLMLKIHHQRLQVS